MEHEVKPRALRLIHGTPAEVETQIHELYGRYVVTSMTFHQLSDRVLITAALVLDSEVRKQQLANIQPIQPRRQ